MVKLDPSCAENPYNPLLQIAWQATATTDDPDGSRPALAPPPRAAGAAPHSIAAARDRRSPDGGDRRERWMLGAQVDAR